VEVGAEGVGGEVVVIVVVEGERGGGRDRGGLRGVGEGGVGRGDAVLEGGRDGEVVHCFPGLAGGVKGGGRHGVSAFGFDF